MVVSPIEVVKTCALIGLFALARTVSGYENQALIGQVKERNVVRKRAAENGDEERHSRARKGGKNLSSRLCVRSVA